MPSALEICVRLFPERPTEAGRLLRTQFSEEPEGFEASAYRVLESFEDSPGHLYVLGLLAGRDRLLPLLCRLAGERNAALEAIAEVLPRVDPGFEQRAVRKLRRVTEQGLTQERDQLLQLLGFCRAGAALTPSLTPLLNSGDTRVSSKAALLAGRAVASLEWFQVRLSDPDQRVRANAVEALWGSSHPWAPSLFRLASGDPHPRVVANAWIGLYLAGCVESIEELTAMARRSDPGARASAAWAMGHLADVRFQPVLKELLKEPSGSVTRRALEGLRRVKEREEAAASAPSLALGCLRMRSSDQLVTADLTFLTRQPLQPGQFLPVNWLVGTPGQWITRPDAEVQFTDSYCAVLLVPQLSGLAAESVLPWKRGEDSWAIVRYAPGRRGVHHDWSGQAARPDAAVPAAGQAGEPNASVRLLRDPRALAAAWPQGSNANQTAPSLLSALGGAIQALRRRSGARAIVVYLTSEATADSLTAALSLAGQEGLDLHLTGPSSLPATLRDPLEFNAHGRPGTVLWSAPEEPGATDLVCAGLRSRIQVRAPQPAGSELHIRLQSPELSGSLVLRL